MHSYAERENGQNSSVRPTLIDLATHDSETVSDIIHTCTAMDPWLQLGIDTEQLLASCSSQAFQRICYSINIEGEIAGILCLQFPWLKGMYIERVALFKPFQNRGFGAAIMHLLETEYQAKTNNIWLLVSAFNAGARRFYQRHGFVEIGCIKDFITVNQDEILMRKVLTPNS